MTAIHFNDMSLFIEKIQLMKEKEKIERKLKRAEELNRYLLNSVDKTNTVCLNLIDVLIKSHIQSRGSSLKLQLMKEIKT